MQKYPERHNFSLSDIISGSEKTRQPRKSASEELPPAEPSMPGAPMAEAKPEMAALEKAVDAGMKVNLGKPFVENRDIILPFDIMTKDRNDEFQLRVAIDMDAPMAKRFKIVVKNFKKK